MTKISIKWQFHPDLGTRSTTLLQGVTTNDFGQLFWTNIFKKSISLFFFLLTVFIRIYCGSEEQETGVPWLPSDVMCQMLITGRSNYALHIGAFSPEFGLVRGNQKPGLQDFGLFWPPKYLLMVLITVLRNLH